MSSQLISYSSRLLCLSFVTFSTCLTIVMCLRAFFSFVSVVQTQQERTDDEYANFFICTPLSFSFLCIQTKKSRLLIYFDWRARSIHSPNAITRIEKWVLLCATCYPMIYATYVNWIFILFIN